MKNILISIQQHLLLLCSVSLIGLSCVPQQKMISDNPFILEEDERPWIIAHGGGKKLFPENTMYAFEEAMKLKVDALEMDINLTKDSILVTHHDATVDRTSDGTGKVIDFSFDELLNFNFGEKFKNIDGEYPFKNIPIKIAKVSEVFERFGEMPLIVEIKNKGAEGKLAAEKLLQLIKNYSIEKIVVASFHDEVLEHFRTISEDAVVVSTAVSETKSFVFSSILRMPFIYKPKGAVVEIPLEAAGFKLGKKRFIKLAHLRNMAIHYWTIDDKNDMLNLIKNGVDGLITDRPDLMWEVLKEMGY